MKSCGTQNSLENLAQGPAALGSHYNALVDEQCRIALNSYTDNDPPLP